MNVVGGFRSASDRSVRAAYDAASVTVDAARAPSAEDWSDDLMALPGGMAGSSATAASQVRQSWLQRRHLTWR